MNPGKSTELARAYGSLTLSPPVSQSRPPALVILTGLPGTGKTYLARALCACAPFTLVGSDALRALLFPTPVFSPAENSTVYNLADTLLYRLLGERRDVIYDAVNLSEQRRAALRRLARKADGRPLTVLVTAPEHVVWLRLADRRDQPAAPGDSGATWEIYRKLATRFVRVGHPHLVVDTSLDLQSGVEAILEEINAPRPVDPRLCG